MATQLAFLSSVGLQGGSDVQIRVSDRRVLQDYLAQHVTDERFAATCVIVDKFAKIGADKTSQLLTKKRLRQSLPTT